MFSSPQKPSTISLTLLLILLFYHSNKANLSRDLFQLKGKNVLKGKISIMQTLLDIFSVRSYYGEKNRGGRGKFYCSFLIICIRAFSQSPYTMVQYFFKFILSIYFLTFIQTGCYFPYLHET